ncbi:excalibur calcium-binding domain-containing protein [Cellulomonas sp. NPDC055163]
MPTTGRRVRNPNTVAASVIAGLVFGLLVGAGCQPSATASQEYRQLSDHLDATTERLEAARASEARTREEAESVRAAAATTQQSADAALADATARQAAVDVREQELAAAQAEIDATKADLDSREAAVAAAEARVSARAGSSAPAAPAPEPAPKQVTGAYENCAAARAAGAAPVLRGEPGYGSHLDRDGDGVGCE